MRGVMIPFGLMRGGALYLVFVLLVSLAAVRAGSNTLYALLAVMLSAIVVSGIVSRNTLKQLALTLQTPDRIFAGKTVTTRVSLTNTKRLFPSLAIFVEEKNPPGKSGRTAFFPILRAGETRSERLEQTFPRRGRQRQTLQSATRFPFGFFLRQNPLLSQELLVYPAIGEVPESLRQSDVLSGRRESRQRGSGENFYSIREYQEGESARIIDWKATAKAQKLMAREYAREDELRCLLILDTYAVLPEEDQRENIEKTGELFEKAVSLAAGLAAYYIHEGALLEFLTPEVHIPASSGDRHLYRILEALALTRRQTTAELFCSTGSTPTAQDSVAHEVIAKPSRLVGNVDILPAFSEIRRRDACASMSADLQKLILGQALSVILTPLPEENFPAGIRRFARIISI